MECGKHRKNPNSRIYRGKDATKNMFSYYIDLTVGYPDIKDPNSKTGFVQIFGGGALISKQHILTVAHLFYPQMKKKLVLYYLCIYYEFFHILLTIYLSPRDLSNIDGKAFAGFLDPRQVEKFTENGVFLYPDNTLPGKLELYIYDNSAPY